VTRLTDKEYDSMLDEIERLKGLIMECDTDRWEIRVLKALCVRAADALAGCTWQERDKLITELRKAAE